MPQKSILYFFSNFVCLRNFSDKSSKISMSQQIVVGNLEKMKFSKNFLDSSYSLLIWFFKWLSWPAICSFSSSKRCSRV